MMYRDYDPVPIPTIMGWNKVRKRKTLHELKKE